MPRASERTVVVEARDLDTDERTVAILQVDMPGTEAAQREQLAALVARLHPDAHIRSFGGGVASFLDSQRLVVAHYVGSGDQSTDVPSPGPTELVEQQPLFAA